VERPTPAETIVPRLLRPDEGQDLRWHPDGHVSDRTRAFVANPGMPTGNHFTDEEWEAVASICRERDVWLRAFPPRPGCA
jgi:aspartate/methionine/tyrosine aminotransferase